MKTFLLLLFVSLAINKAVVGQPSCACCNSAIETPAVSKPTDPGILSVTCNTLTVKWKGHPGQSYVVDGTFTQPSSNSLLTLADPVSITVDDANNCTATIPVVAGSRVSWTVKAVQQIDDRTFSSYTLRAMQDYPVPACNRPMGADKTTGSDAASASEEQLIISNDKFAMYPNPVSDALNMKLSSAYKGAVKLTVVDVSGKAVIVMNGEKQAGDYYNRISVSSLKPGMYIINVQMHEGKAFAAKFLKN